MPTVNRQPKRRLLLKSAAARQAQGPTHAPGARPRQTDRWERQADAAATRILRGEQKIGYSLSSAPAATYRVASSLGAPLPAGVRQELELGFGADLGAVRIHSNVYSAAAARRENARAFAAGRDIYFGQGAYRPESEAGKQLLAHEVAHVLQQTGRRSGDDRLEAASVHGSGPIQRSEIDDLFLTEADLASLSIDKIIEQHKDPDTAAKRKFIKFIRDTLKATPGNEKPLWDDLKKRSSPTAANSLHAEPLEVKMLVYDLLKFNKSYAEAMYIAGSSHDGTPLILSSDFKTALPLKEFYLHWFTTLNQTVGNVLMKIWQEHPYFDQQSAPLGPLTFIQDLRIFFLGVSRFSTVADFNNHQFKKKAKSQLEAVEAFKKDFAAGKKTNLQPNEFFFATLIAVGDVLKFRNKLVDDARHKMEKGISSRNLDSGLITPSRKRRAVAFHFNDLLITRYNALLPRIKASLTARKVSGLSMEAARLLAHPAPDGIGIKMRDASANAVKYWDSIFALSESIFEAPFEKIEEGTLPFFDRELKPEDLYELMAKSSGGKILNRELLNWFNPGGLLSLNRDGSMPEPEKYEEAINQTIERLQKLNKTNKHFERALVNQFQREVILRDYVRPKQALAQGLLIFAVEAIVQELRQYDREDDEANIKAFEAFEATVKNEPGIPASLGGRDDIRIKHRVRLSQTLTVMGNVLQSGQLKEKVFEFANASLQYQKEDIFAIYSDWKYDPGGEELSELRDDFSESKRIPGLEPFSARDLYLFFRTMYQNQLAASILEALEKDKKPGVDLQDPKRDLILNRGHRAAMRKLEGKFPKRYVIEDNQFTLLEKRQGDKGRASLGQLILQHWKTVRLLRREGVYNDDDRIAYTIPGRVVLWIIPSVSLLIRQIRNDPDLLALNHIIRVVWQSTTNEEITLDKVKALGHKEWWTSLWNSWELVFSGKATQLSSSQIKAIKENFRKSFRIYRKDIREGERTSRERLVSAAREASIFERQGVNERITNLLNAYDLGGSILDKVTPKGFPEMYKYRIPDFVLDEIDTFVYRQIYPSDDWPYHMAAMMLENAALLEKKLNPDNYFTVTRDVGEIALSYINRIQFALEVSGKGGQDPPQSIKEGRKIFPELLQESWKKDTSKLSDARRSLTTLEKSLKKVIKKQQYSIGLAGKAHAGKEGIGAVSNVGTGSSFEISASENESALFQIDGIKWHVKEVRRNFVYYPAQRVLASSKTQTSQTAGESVLIVDGKEIPKDQRKSIELMILNIGESSTDTIITGDMDEVLRKFMYALSMRGTIVQLENLAGMIKSSFTFALEAAEFIPGPGWVILATRMFAGIMSFIQSADFQNISEIIQTVPEQIKALPDALKENLTPEKILEFIIFADHSKLAALEEKLGKKTSSGAASASTRKKGRLGKIVAKLKNLGVIVLKAFSRIQDGVQNIIERFQVFFFRHPLAANALQWIMDRLPLLKAKVSTFADTPLPGNLGALADNLNKNIVEIPDKIESIKLPETLVSLDMLVDVVIRLAVKSLGKKAELVAEGLIWGLKEAGLYKKLVKAITEQITVLSDDKDPLSEPWKKAVQEYGDPLLNDAYDRFRVMYNDYFAGIGLAGFSLAKIPDKQIRFQFEGSLEETAPYPSYGFDADQAGLQSSLKFLGEGSPLDDDLRRSIENRFGLDFSHVRLHNEGKAGQLSDQLGVEGLTSGSHIILKPGLSPKTGEGQRIFYHELAHVLQQTGAAPVDSNQVQKPTLGQANKGLRLNDKEERQADQISREALRPGSGPSANQITPGTAQGVQPAGFMERLFGRLLNVAELREMKGELEERSPAGTLPSGLDGNIRRSVEKMGERLFSELLSDDNLLEQPFRQEKDNIRDLLRLAKKDISRVLLTLAKDAQTNEKIEGGKKPKYLKVLNRSELANSLTKYILIKTGILLHISLRKAPATDKKKDQDLIHATKPFRELQVVDLLLSEVYYQSAAGKALWDQILKKNFNVTNDEDEAKKVRAYVRSYLRSNFPVSGLWIKSDFKFSAKVANDIQDTIDTAGGQQPLHPDDLPPVKKYADPHGAAVTSNKTNQSLGHVGLRVGKHKDSNQKGSQRESHHTIQFLLLDYFFHDSTNHQPFVLLENSSIGNRRQVYPGLNVVNYKSKDRPESFAGNTTLQIKAMDHANRGGEMPAILLARPTHRKAGLHVTPGKVDDFGNNPGDSPSTVVDYWFTSSLDQEYKDAEKKADNQKTAKPFTDYVDRKGPSDVSDIIYKAMNKTYEKMYDFMIPRLESALLKEEKNYYNALAEEKSGSTSSAYEYTDAHGKAVFKAARDKTNELMHDRFKWKKKG